MAGIDKIYGTRKQEIEFREWCKDNFPEALDYFITWADEWLTDNHEHPITNFPEWVDKKLLKICPIDFVTARSKAKYGLEEKRQKEKYIRIRNKGATRWK